MKKLFIANRAEIALRIIRAAQAMGISTVVPYAWPDYRSPVLRAADEAILLPGIEVHENYSNIPVIIEAIKNSGADAVHPGYGFLSENADFVREIQKLGITFIGPDADIIEKLGDKIQARKIAKQAQVSILPAVVIDSNEIDKDGVIAKQLDSIGFPMIIKAAAGGGGRGMRLVHSTEEALAQIESASIEAQKFFGNGQVYIEKFIENPKHIEVQVLADTHGTVLHLGDRECSAQRRHQKVIEEAPSPSLNQAQRDDLYQQSVNLIQSVNYKNAATVEFVLAPDGNFYFLEVNTRLQVEHPITEAITGIDLVQEQLKIARGEKLSFDQSSVQLTGHAFEVRICAEDPEENFLPSTGKISFLKVPDQGPDQELCRWDAFIEKDLIISPYYDSMLAKLIVHAGNRDAAIEKLNQALKNLVILGIRHNRDFLLDLINQEFFQSGLYHTQTIAEFIPNWLVSKSTLPAEIKESLLTSLKVKNFSQEKSLVFSLAQDFIDLYYEDRHYRIARPSNTFGADEESSEQNLCAPLPGKIVKIFVQVGDQVEAKQALVTLEAMKMEYVISATQDSVVEKLPYQEGEQVQKGKQLIFLEQAQS